MLSLNVRPLRVCRLRVALPLLVVTPCVALAAPVHADAPVVGVRAWTSGSQTFIRVRPSDLTPPVAKVPSRTPLYVWGRFNNWYRVETHDHIFGWVLTPYLKSPNLKKVKVISHFKAKQASDKGSSQTMYGTVAELKAYHAQYGGTGALKGLALRGIYLSPKKNAPVLMARNPQMAPRVELGTTQQLNTSTVANGALTVSGAAQAMGKATESMAPAASSLAGAVRSWTPGNSTTPAAVNPTPAPLTTPRVPVVVPTPAPSRPSAIVPPVPSPQTYTAPPVNLPRIIAPIVSAPPVQATNTVQPLAPVLPGSNLLMAPVPQLVVATRPAPKPVAVKPASKAAAPKPLTAEQKHILAWQARKRAKEQRWAWLQKKKANAYKWRVAQAQKKAEAARNRHLWLAKQRQNRAIYLASRKGKQREILGASVGLAPKKMPSQIPGTMLAPISPDELLKAREQYINKGTPQNIKQVVPVPTSPGTPFVPSGLPVPNSSDDLKGNLNVLLFGTAEQKKEAARGLSEASAEESSGGQGDSDAATTPSSSSMPVPYVPAAPAQSTVPAPSRGGSPRDRALMAWQNGVANQALSYRGMPYIFGAASPSRGFDCSGLIYFLLRQRGLNPPRTAAGYRNYGKPVARGQWKTGDLILFANTYKRGISHIGVYLKDNKFIHAASSKKGVRVDSLNTAYYASKYWGARRVK